MTRRVLAGAALVLGLLAAAAGDRRPSGVNRTLLDEVARGTGTVSAVEVARWIRDGREGLRLVDLRDSSAYAEFHLPLAQRRTLAALATEPPGTSPLTVLYADDGPLAAQVWLILRSRGIPAEAVRYLAGGTGGWILSVEAPLLPEDATPEELSRWTEVRALSEYFGGRPSRGPRREAVPIWLQDAPASGARGTLQAVPRRRGCGF